MMRESRPPQTARIHHALRAVAVIGHRPVAASRTAFRIHQNGVLGADGG